MVKGDRKREKDDEEKILTRGKGQRHEPPPDKKLIKEKKDPRGPKSWKEGVKNGM